MWNQIFYWRNDLYANEEFSRRRPETILETGEIMQIAAPEDIILTKLLWYKDGGCVADRHYQDAEGVLLVQADLLDQNYLRHWAKMLGVDDWLEKLLLEIHND